MYVAGATSIDSFVIDGDSIGWMDGTTALALIGGGAPPNGSTGQIGVVNATTLLVTLKTDPVAGTVDIISLRGGAVTSAAPVSVSAPAGTLTPFGFSVYPDGTALITLAHSSQYGLLRDGMFKTVIDAGEMAPCWTTRVGKYVFTSNTRSMTISRLLGTGKNIFVDSPVAARIATGGGPTDIDAAGGILAVIDHGGGTSHLSMFTYNEFGELTASGTPIDLGAANANGIVVIAPKSQHNTPGGSVPAIPASLRGYR